PRAAIEPLALLDGFPSLVQRRQVPPAASRANDPQPSAYAVECQPGPSREVLNHVVLAELTVAEQARAVHAASLIGLSLTSNVMGRMCQCYRRGAELTVL